MSRAVFADRDGTVIVDRGYLATVEGVTLLPDAGPAFGRLCAAGLLLVIVTNQSGIGRGLFSSEVVSAQHRRLAELLAAFGVRLAAVEVCPHAPWENCTCRKPAPGLLLQAAKRLAIDLPSSFMIGDKTTDIAAGQAAGCRTVALGRLPDCHADYAADSLTDAADWILGCCEED